MRWFYLLLCTLITGCSSKICDPWRYVEVPCTWSTCHEDFREGESDCFCFWKALNDPILDEIIERLPNQNLDLLLKAEQIYSTCANRNILRQEYRILWNEIVSDTARTYIELRLQQARHAIIDMRAETFGFVDELKSIGLANSVQSAQDQERLSFIKADRPEINLKIEKAIHHLSFLLGYVPSELYCRLICPKPLPALPCSIPVRSPCLIINQRPDIKKLELEVQLGVQPVRSYQRGVLLALEDIENALAAYKYDSERAHLLFIAIQESYKAYIQLDELYSKGLKNYLDIQDVKRDYLTSYEAYLGAQVSLLLDYIKISAFFEQKVCCNDRN